MTRVLLLLSVDVVVLLLFVGCWLLVLVLVLVVGCVLVVLFFVAEKKWFCQQAKSILST